jgi:hypothetical protein
MSGDTEKQADCPHKEYSLHFYLITFEVLFPDNLFKELKHKAL